MKQSLLRQSILALLLTIKMGVFAGTFVVNGIKYKTTSSSTVEVTSKYPEYGGDIVIPESVYYDGKTYSVTSIGSKAFLGCSSLNSVTIPNGVTKIGSSAFTSCSSLISVTIPDSVTSIEKSAFMNCRNLASVTIGNRVTKIGIGAFDDCISLSSVHISDLAAWCNIYFDAYSGGAGPPLSNPLYYAHHLFLNGLEIKDLVIPNSVTSIGNAFYNCSGLTALTIHDNVTSIGVNAFCGCSGLSSVTIGSRVTEIKSGAFEGCHRLRVKTLTSTPPHLESPINVNSLEVPIGATVDYATAQYWNDADTIFAVSNGAHHYPLFFAEDGEHIVTVSPMVGNGIEVASDTKITLIADGTNRTTNLVMVGDYDASETIFNKGEFDFYPSPSYRLIHTYAYASKDIHVANSGTLVSIIGKDNLDNTLSLKLSGELNGTDILAIRKMKNLKILDLTDASIVDGGQSYYGNYVTSKDIVGDCLFYERDSLLRVMLPQSVTSIGKSAFSDCSSLISVTIPNSVSSIGRRAFSGCSSLTSMTIPNSVTSIEDEAFMNCSSLTSVTIPNSVTSNGCLTFTGCSSLTSVTIPNSVTSIGNDAFSWCSSLTSVTIPNSVISIGNRAFYDCSSLTSVTIPNSVTSIEHEAFYGCCSLTSVTIPNSITSIGEMTFMNCSSLTSVTIPNSITSIGEAAFYACRNLASVTIPNGVLKIEDSTFEYCSRLQSIIIPNSVTSIGVASFRGCTNLISVTSLNTIPPIIRDGFVSSYWGSSYKISANAFDKATYNDATIYVPNGCKNIYWLHPYWENFKNIEEIEVSTINNTLYNNDKNEGYIYNLNGTKVNGNHLDKGIYIKNGKKVIIK